MHDRALVNSARMRVVNEMINRVAATDATVLVWGESGVGKDIVARVLHQRSQRGDRPFVKVNCAALPIELLESELFGYERGAFTGAHRRKPGKFELADKGTIVLDEIGEMPLPIQAKLLHVLQDGEFSLLGSKSESRVDVRVVALTNKHLRKVVEQGGFREDLYYRINVVSIHVPPLRDRREEIPILVEYFLEKYAKHYARPRQHLSAETVRLFMEHSWPGNIRELENLVKRIVVLGSEDWVAQELGGGTPDSDDGAVVVRQPGGGEGASPRGEDGRQDEELGLKALARRAGREAERMALRAMLERVHWNRGEAARRLKISYTALLYKIKQHDLKGVAAIERVGSRNADMLPRMPG